jgi:hypothetical protein
VSPEIVPVTINQQIIQINDSPAMFRSESFSYGDSDDNRTFALDFYPYEAKSVEVYLNSGAQRYGTDYSVQGQYVVLNVALAAGDQILVRYLSVDGTVASQTTSVGMLIGSAGLTLDGFLRMDGTTSHLWADYPTLKNWFWADGNTVSSGIGDPNDLADQGATRRSQLLVPGYDGTTFQLVSLQDTSYNGVQLVTMNKFISFGAAV